MQEDHLRAFALIGARVKLTDLEQQVKETKELIRLLSKAKHLRHNGRAKGKRRKHSDAFKAKVVIEAKAQGIAKTARKYALSRSMVDKWVARAK